MAPLFECVVRGFVFQRSHPVTVGFSILAGAAAAHHLGMAVALASGLSAAVSSYIIGLCAMALCQSAISNLIEWVAQKLRRCA